MGKQPGALNNTNILHWNSNFKSSKVTITMREWYYKNHTIYDYKQLDSTNQLALDLIKKNNLKHGDIILARKQIAGKGRYGRNWISPIGNLYFSLVIRKQNNSNKISLLSFISVVALGNTISNLNNQLNISYKWPNDLLINNKKVAGILLESDKSNYIIIGIGVNVNSSPKDTTYPADNLSNLDIKNISPNIILENYLDNFDSLYAQWLSFGFEPIRNLWLKRACNLNKRITTTLNYKKLNGIFRNLDNNGNLVLELKNKELKLISSGEIFLLEN